MPSTTPKGVPYAVGTDAASDLDTITQSLAEWVDARPGTASMTTVQRNALSGASLWVGRVIYNEDSKTIQSYDGVAWNGIRTVDLANNAVANDKLRDSAALSVIGRSANSVGDPSDMAAGTDGHVLRRSGTGLGFGTVATTGLGDNTVTPAKLTVVNGCHLLRASSTLASFVRTNIAWTSEADDNGGFWSSGTNVVIPAGLNGIYVVTAIVKVTSGAGRITTFLSKLNVDGFQLAPAHPNNTINTTNPTLDTMSWNWCGRLAAGNAINVTVEEAGGQSVNYQAEIQVWQVGRY